MTFSDGLRFEDAARIRDQIQSVDQVLQRQNVAHRESISWDVIGLAWTAESCNLSHPDASRTHRACSTGTLEHGGEPPKTKC